MKAAVDILEERISTAMKTVAGRDDCAAIVRPATDAKFGDYQANGVMALAKKLKTNPRKLAEKVVNNLDISDICEPPEVAGPGFINLRLKAEFVAGELLEINEDINDLGVEKTPKPKTYVVQKGDHLMQIARELGLDWKEIAALNGLTYPYILYPGQVLILPGSGATPEPSSGDSSGGSSSEYSGTTYVVQKGDYLVALGRKFGIDWRVLASYNGITYPYIIHPGQVLKIP